MGSWGHAPTDDTRCGYCRALIPKGEPVYLVTKAKRLRCIACAAVDYQAYPPGDLPPAASTAEAIATKLRESGAVPVPDRHGRWTLLREVRRTPLFDAKAAASGDTVPGKDPTP